MPATPYIDRDDLTFYQGDCRQVLAQLPEQSIQCCVTSPPYWGQRDYDVQGQLGLEQTPELYLDELVTVFRAVRRVLAPDGTLWLNLGDTYASNWGHGAKRKSSWWSSRSGELAGKGWGQVEVAIPPNCWKRHPRTKAKDLIGLPWRAALALQADGWYLRGDVIWHKTNAQGERVRDRPSRAHEYLFLLAPNSRYRYDAQAVRREGRHLRSVWEVPVRACEEMHTATFPPALIEPCILAGSRPGDIVLDPFAGAGTTAMVARQHGRRFVGVELNADYLDLTRRRLWPDQAAGAA